MMRRLTSILLILIVVGPLAEAVVQKGGFDASSLTENGRESYNRLLHSEAFAIGGVGLAGSTSPYELALRALLKETQAVPALESLLQNATTEGKMYAFFGLYLSNREVFRAWAQRYKDDKALEGLVLTQAGCMLVAERQQAVLSNIEAGLYDVLYQASSDGN